MTTFVILSPREATNVLKLALDTRQYEVVGNLIRCGVGSARPDIPAAQLDFAIRHREIDLLKILICIDSVYGKGILKTALDSINPDDFICAPDEDQKKFNRVVNFLKFRRAILLKGETGLTKEHAIQFLQIMPREDSECLLRQYHNQLPRLFIEELIASLRPERQSGVVMPSPLSAIQSLRAELKAEPASQALPVSVTATTVAETPKKSLLAEAAQHQDENVPMELKRPNTPISDTPEGTPSLALSATSPPTPLERKDTPLATSEEGHSETDDELQPGSLETDEPGSLSPGIEGRISPRRTAQVTLAHSFFNLQPGCSQTNALTLRAGKEVFMKNGRNADGSPYVAIFSPGMFNLHLQNAQTNTITILEEKQALDHRI